MGIFSFRRRRHPRSNPDEKGMGIFSFRRRRHPRSGLTNISVYTPRNSAVIQPKTPSGFNKNRRDCSKFLLVITACCMLMGYHMSCILLSAASILAMTEATFFSVKNLKWIILSTISFNASLTAFVMMQGHNVVDEDKAYGLKFTLWFAAKYIPLVWGVILSLFMVSAVMSMAPTHTR
jgi:hypothetical protein